MKKKVNYRCECCQGLFQKKEMSWHHIWPKEWYHGSGPLAHCCITCHRLFEKLNPHVYVWDTRDAETRWAKFCEDYLANKNSSLKLNRRSPK